MLLEAESQTKYCFSPKSKDFDPLNFGLATPLILNILLLAANDQEQEREINESLLNFSVSTESNKRFFKRKMAAKSRQHHW